MSLTATAHPATPPTDSIPEHKWYASEAAFIAAFVIVKLGIHFVFNRGYGYFRDELYYLACGQHLDWGYVDQPPLVALAARFSRVLFGDSLSSVRLLPALAGALKVALAGMIAREFGGRRWAVALACVAVLFTPVYLGIDNFLSMNTFEPVFWMGCAYFVTRIGNGASSKLWLWFGVLLGLGLENKHSTVFFGVAILSGLLLTPLRCEFAKKWIWLGALIAFLTALPNVIWEIQHHWATYELLSNVAHSNKNIVLGPVAFIGQQILMMNPASLPLWLSGLVWLLIARDGRKYRALGIAYIVLLAEMMLLHGKNYYLAPIYPMLFAAGGVLFERAFALRLRWLKPAIAAAMVLIGALVAPTIMPILPPEKLVAYMKSIHFEPPRTETSHTAALPQVLADQFGWQEMTEAVARAYNSLPAEDRKKAGIFAQNYGEAGAIDFFGPKLGLPPALSGHQNYFLWGTRGYTGEVLLVLDDNARDEREQFESVEDLGPIQSSPWAMPWEQRLHIYLCRGLKVPLEKLWPELKVWM